MCLKPSHIHLASFCAIHDLLVSPAVDSSGAVVMQMAVTRDSAGRRAVHFHGRQSAHAGTQVRRSMGSLVGIAFSHNEHQARSPSTNHHQSTPFPLPNRTLSPIPPHSRTPPPHSSKSNQSCPTPEKTTLVPPVRLMDSPSRPSPQMQKLREHPGDLTEHIP